MNLGLIVKELGLSQRSYYATRNMNLAARFNLVNDCCIFWEQVSPTFFKTIFSTMNSSEIWEFNGTLISTCVSTTLTAQKAVNSAKRFFYVWDLEWMRRYNGRNADYKYNIEAFTDKDTSLIARSKSHASAIKNYCNRDVCGIVEDFNIEQLMEVINNE